MKKNAYEYLFNEAIKYLGKYPATKKKMTEILKKKINNNKIYHKINFPDNFDKNLLIESIIVKLDELKIINENYYLESMFDYYERSLFSIRKIKSKLFQKGFDQNNVDEFIDHKLQKNPDIEVDILKKYIIKKKLSNLEETELKKKLYQQRFDESSIYRVIKS